MHCGGLQPNSMIDYPGKISCVVFFSGCNFRCPYCHNPQLVVNGRTKEAPLLTKEVICRFLERRRDFLEAVVLSGGEPTLQEKDLVDLCKKIRRMGFEVKLDTNGSRPEVLKRLLDEKLLDYVAMDIKTDPKKHRIMRHVFHMDCGEKEIRKSIEFVMGSGVQHEFRTTCFKSAVDEATILSICHLIRHADLYVLQRFRDTVVLDPDLCKSRVNSYSDARLEDFRNMASAHVSQCILR